MIENKKRSGIVEYMNELFIFDVLIVLIVIRVFCFIQNTKIKELNKKIEYCEKELSILKGSK